MEEKKINQMSLANCDLDEVEIVLGDRFELKIEDGKYYAIRKKPTYPKDYEECCKNVDDARYVNSITDDIMINQITNKVSVIKFKPDVCDNKIELQLGDYEIEVLDGKTYAVKKKPAYPTTYAECCKVIGYGGIIGFAGLGDDEENLYGKFISLKRCRDAYWKIAGEQLELGKPWEPDWSDNDQPKFGIHNVQNNICTINLRVLKNLILVFPTIEMREYFHKNFKNLIETCKELL